ncbi:MAG: IS66 family transposase zinc-finger binding domain-containing protein, partial [Polyangiaceae bacterium]
MDIERERDIEQLRLIARTQQKQIEQLLRVVNAKSKELEALKGDPNELQQTLELLARLQAQVDHGKPKAKRKAKGEKKQRERFGNTSQPKLKQTEQVFELDASERKCPECGGEAELIGEDVSELVDCIQVSYHLKRVIQRKYACKCGKHLCTAPGPERATPGSRYSLNFAIKACSDKYCDHLPRSRQGRS